MYRRQCHSANVFTTKQTVLSESANFLSLKIGNEASVFFMKNKNAPGKLISGAIDHNTAAASLPRHFMGLYAQ